MIAPAKVFNVDNEYDRLALRRESALPGYAEVIPRDYEARPYGAIGDIPAISEAAPDVLVSPSDFKSVITEAHDLEQFPMHHQLASWAPEDEFASNQNGLGYCWTWSGTACMMDLRAIHKLDTIMLAPVSMGFLVGWKNKGNYLESYIKGARERGVCPAPDGDFNMQTRSSSFWAEHDSERIDFRLDKVWDIDTRSGDAKTLQHCLSCLYYGCPIYIAYNWWGHALELVGLIWDESKLNNVIWVIRNSHNKKELLLLEGTKGVPDECYAFVSLKVGKVA